MSTAERNGCPNCDATMNPGEPCPECDHDDGDLECECTYCWERNSYEPDLGDNDSDSYPDDDRGEE